MQQPPPQYQHVHQFISENKQVISTFLKHLCFRPDIATTALVENGVTEFDDFNIISNKLFSYIYKSKLIDDGDIDEDIPHMSFEELVNTALQFDLCAFLLRADVVKYMIENNLDNGLYFYEVQAETYARKINEVIKGIKSSSKANEPRYIKILEELNKY